MAVGSQASLASSEVLGGQRKAPPYFAGNDRAVRRRESLPRAVDSKRCVARAKIIMLSLAVKVGRAPRGFVLWEEKPTRHLSRETCRTRSNTRPRLSGSSFVSVVKSAELGRRRFAVGVQKTPVAEMSRLGTSYPTGMLPALLGCAPWGLQRTSFVRCRPAMPSVSFSVL